eukprot:3552674-Amphidinium_carterae.1
MEKGWSSSWRFMMFSGGGLMRWVPHQRQDQCLEYYSAGAGQTRAFGGTPWVRSDYRHQGSWGGHSGAR